MNVPIWNDYYPALENANKEQIIFYNLWLNNFRNNIYLDIEDNLSYIFVYLYSLINKFTIDKNISYLEQQFGIIQSNYSNQKKIIVYLRFWLKDAYLHIGDYKKAWLVLKNNFDVNSDGKQIDFSEFLNIVKFIDNLELDGQDLLRILGKGTGITKFGTDNLEKILILVTIFLKDFHISKGNNLIEYFVKQFNLEKLTNEDFINLKEYFKSENDYYFWYDIETQGWSEKTGKKISQDIKDWSEKNRKTKTIYYTHSLFAGCTVKSPLIKDWIILPSIVEVALMNEIKRIFRESENTVREEQNLPKVGEGWISETELYYKLINSFPEEKIIHHARPIWLGKQHIDIYFQRINVAIEYQGLQHIKPIEFFGGEKSFIENQKRDLKKKKLCEENNCELICVFENYNFDELVSQIKQFMSK